MEPGQADRKAQLAEICHHSQVKEGTLNWAIAESLT